MVAGYGQAQIHVRLAYLFFQMRLPTFKIRRRIGAPFSFLRPPQELPAGGVAPRPARHWIILHSYNDSMGYLMQILSEL
jgi:hypothetical protein